MNSARVVVAATASALLALAAGCAHDETAGVLARTTEVLDPASIERILARRNGAGDVVEPGGGGRRAQDDQPVLLLKSGEFSAHLLQIAEPLPRRLHRGHDLTLFVYRGAGDVVIEDLRRRARSGDLFHIPRSTPYLVNPRSDGPLMLVAFYTPPLEQPDTVELPADEVSYDRGE